MKLIQDYSRRCYSKFHEFEQSAWISRCFAFVLSRRIYHMHDRWMGSATGGCWQSESERVIYIQREGETRLGTPKYTASAFAVVCFRFPLHTIFILRGFAPVVTVGHPRFHVARGQLPESIFFSSIDTATRTSYNHEARYTRVSIFFFSHRHPFNRSIIF